MNWGRAKTILIILFLAIDVLLLCLLSVVNNDVNYINTKTATDAANVLNQHNIKVSKEQIPLKRSNKTVLYFENLAYRPEKLVKMLFGENYKSNVSNVYESGTETVKAENSSILYENKRESMPCSSFNEIKKTVLSDLKKFGFKKNEVFFNKADIKNGICYIEIMLKYDDKLINGTELFLEADLHGIKKMQGRWFDLSKAEKTNEKLPDVTSLLVNMIYNPDLSGFEIKKIGVEYYIDSDYIDSAETCAYPCHVVRGKDNSQYILE